MNHFLFGFARVATGVPAPVPQARATIIENTVHRRGIATGIRWLLVALVSFLSVPLARAETMPVSDDEGRRLMASESFLRAHPDLRYRSKGWQAYEQGDFDIARRHFLAAASYGDKPAQAMLAEMIWNGQGQEADRPVAYAWADISAERGNGRFVALREQYWRQLGDAERVRAIELGQLLMSDYGDEVAKPRLTRHLRRQSFAMAGRRPRKDTMVVVQGPGNLPMAIRGHDFYADKFWNPVKYQE